jgi:hypothetical protein
MPVTVADKLERALSEAWNRYDARVYWRVQTELGGQGSNLLNCTIGLTNFDLYRGIWDRQLLTNVPSSEFCDGINPDWFLYIPTICSLMDSFTFWDKVAESYRRAYTHALLHYYPEYWQDVLEAIAKNIPLALWWDDNWGQGIIRTEATKASDTISSLSVVLGSIGIGWAGYKAGTAMATAKGASLPEITLAGKEGAVKMILGAGQLIFALLLPIYMAYYVTICSPRILNSGNCCGPSQI